MSRTKDRVKDRVLAIIDDDKIFCDAVALHFEDSSYRVLVANTCKDGLAVCSDNDVDIVLLDQRLPDGNGVDLCPEIIAKNDKAKIIFVTAYPEFETAKAAIRFGAYDYLSKPFEIDELEVVIDRAAETQDLEMVRQIHKYREKKERGTTELIGMDGGLAEVGKIVERAAQSDSPVLLTGETGAGKSFVAKYIHYRRSKPAGSFISVNCASLPHHLVEAELFGYEKGSFTGAVASRKGLFEMAKDGTLLLDEIGELPVELQAKLLDALDEGSIRRVGGNIRRSVAVRIMAATNYDIEAAMKKGAFRPDLFYRLSVIRIHIPPLRERPQDIESLCRHVVDQYPGDRKPLLPSEEIERLKQYHWPGNVRELKNVLERAFILRKGNELRPSMLLEAPVGSPPPSARKALETEEFRDFCKIASGQNLPTLETLGMEYIRFVLRHTSGNRTQAAHVLGVSRSTLLRKIKGQDMDDENYLQ